MEQTYPTTTDTRLGARPFVHRIAWAIWFLLVLAWLGYLFVEHVEGASGCGNSGADATWGWLPPGTTCRYIFGENAAAYVHTDEPSASSLLIPLGLAYAALRLRRA